MLVFLVSVKRAVDIAQLIMSEVQVEIDATGIRLRLPSGKEASFLWTDGSWKLHIEDGRVFTPPPFQRPTIMGAPRITSLDGRGRDEDRSLLGLDKDHNADPVLLTDVTEPGTLSLRYGPLDLRSAPLNDSQARLLIARAFDLGYEVRRLISQGNPRSGGVYTLVTTITPRRASSTPEVQS